MKLLEIQAGQLSRKNLAKVSALISMLVLNLKTQLYYDFLLSIKVYSVKLYDADSFTKKNIR